MNYALSTFIGLAANQPAKYLKSDVERADQLDQDLFKAYCEWENLNHPVTK